MSINKIDRFSPAYVKRSRQEAGLTKQHGYTKPRGNTNSSGSALSPAQQYTQGQLAQKGFDPKYFEAANVLGHAICSY